jgi:hypothetical protein
MRQKYLSWSEFTIEQLTQGGPMSHQDLIAKMKGTTLEERFANSPNAFYARINKLQSTEKLFKVGKILYLPDQYQKLVQDQGLFATQIGGGRH